MNFLNAQTEWQDYSGGASAAGHRPAIALGHIDKDHVSALSHDGARKRALRSFSSSRRFALNCRGNGELLPAIPGNLFFNLSDARNRLRWQALTDLARVRCHLKSLSSVLVQWMKIYLQVRTKNWESPPKFRRAI